MRFEANAAVRTEYKDANSGQVLSYETWHQSGTKSRYEGHLAVGLDLRTVPPIAGENSPTIRDILRRCHGYLTETWLRKALGLSDRKSQKVVRALERSGYVERAGSNEIAYTVTDKGRELMPASAAKRLRRSTAHLALDEFMERVRRVNQNPALLYSIIKVVVFGGFLRGSKN